MGYLSLPEMLLQELYRCRDLCEVYKAIGPSGAFGLTLIRMKMARAERALMNGEAVEIMQSYSELKECQ